MAQATDKQALTEAFYNFDTDYDGYIPVDEMRGLLREGQPMSDAEVEEFVKVADPNGTGMVDYKQFAQFLCAVEETQWFHNDMYTLL